MPGPLKAPSVALQPSKGTQRIDVPTFFEEEEEVGPRSTPNQRRSWTLGIQILSVSIISTLIHATYLNPRNCIFFALPEVAGENHTWKRRLRIPRRHLDTERPWEALKSRCFRWLVGSTGPSRFSWTQRPFKKGVTCQGGPLPHLRWKMHCPLLLPMLAPCWAQLSSLTSGPRWSCTERTRALMRPRLAVSCAGFLHLDLASCKYTH